MVKCPNCLKEITSYKKKWLSVASIISLSIGMLLQAIGLLI